MLGDVGQPAERSVGGNGDEPGIQLAPGPQLQDAQNPYGPDGRLRLRFRDQQHPQRLATPADTIIQAGLRNHPGVGRKRQVRVCVWTRLSRCPCWNLDHHAVISRIIRVFHVVDGMAEFVTVGDMG